MKATGIVRKLDDNGRIVLPMELRKKLSLKDADDALEIFVEGDSVVLKKYEPSCVFCHSMEDLAYYKDKKVCKKCSEKLSLMFE